MKRCLPVFLLSLSLSAHGALNKWVDANGEVHYSDEPPPVSAKEKKTLVTPKPASGAVPSKSVAEREAEWKKAQKARNEAEQKATQEQQTALIRQKNCESARNGLKTLQDSPRVVTYDVAGQSVVMDDDARQRALADARKAVSDYCD